MTSSRGHPAEKTELLQTTAPVKPTVVVDNDGGIGKRSIPVVPPENHSGPMEYKRQVLKHVSTDRIRGLSTQMSFRMDEGHGRCVYRIGVEDNGCHSLLGYKQVAESAAVLECIARSLNAIVIDRVMIQNEVVRQQQPNQMEDGSSLSPSSSPSSSPRSVVKVTDSEPILVHESPLLTLQGGLTSTSTIRTDCTVSDSAIQTSFANDTPVQILRKEPGFFTRAEITIQRIETHNLDPDPLSIQDLSDMIKTMTLNEKTTQLQKQQQRQNKHNDTNNNNIGSITKKMGQMKHDGDSEEEKKKDDDIPSSPSLTDSHNDNNTATPGVDEKPEKMSVGETLSARNIRVAVVGNVDAGKSTLIGTLTTSCLDDGRGKSRTAIMKHRHEIESGRTSTATTHLMGFRHTGEPIAGRDERLRTHKRKSEDEIARESYRIITLMDLAGHEKYLKTTIHGVSSGFADYALILVNSRQPPTHMTQHHLNLCCSFGIPVIVVFTKTDGCPEHAFKTCKEEVNQMLRSREIGKKAYAVRDENDVMTVIDKLHTLAPMLETSCVTGEGIDLLQKLLFCLPKRRRHENKANRSFEFLVEDIFNVPGVGAVTSGFVNAGELHVGPNCHVYVGPTDDGTFMKTVAKTAHIARINTTHVTAGQSACLAFALNKELRKKLRRGMVVLQESPTSTRLFDAEICVLKGDCTTIRRSYQAYVHILNVRQSAFARDIQIVNNNAVGVPNHAHTREGGEEGGIVLRPGSRAKVRFEFAKRPEYIRPGMRMLFRDGRVRGVGIVTAIPPATVIATPVK